jgi:hypothetical protein
MRAVSALSLKRLSTPKRISCRDGWLLASIPVMSSYAPNRSLSCDLDDVAAAVSGWNQTKKSPDYESRTKVSTVAESTRETPILDLLARMTADSVETSSLDPESLMLVRIAALVAADAPSISYLLNLGAASEIGLDPERVRGVLAAIAPIVGTARVASATERIVSALDVAIEIAELEEQGDE